jgi:hypothetical protein
MMSEPNPENPTPEELRAAHRRADKRIRAELGAAIELVELGDVATLGHSEERLAILDRLDAMIARVYKKLAYVRAIKSMAPPACQRRPRHYWKTPHEIGVSLDREQYSSFILVAKWGAAQRLDLKSGRRGVCCLIAPQLAIANRDSASASSNLYEFELRCFQASKLKALVFCESCRCQAKSI